MFDCLIVGDSIAQGVSNFRKDCVAYVQSGINSRDWNRKFHNRPMGAKVVVISLGTNDTRDIRTREELEYLRSSVQSSDRVLWILPPIKERIRDTVWSVAENYGDDVLEILTFSRDGVHPTGAGYREIGKKF